MTDRLIEQARRILNPTGLSPEPMETLRRALVKHAQKAPPGHRGGRQQRAFLRAIADKRFQLYLREQGAEPDFKQGADAPLAATLPWRLQEAEFIRPSAFVARRIYDCYRGLSPTAAASVTVWNVITLHNIATMSIEASFLAATRQSRVSGRGRIQLVLQEHSRSEATEAAPESKKIDDCVRSVFYAMGGLHHVSGHTSVISNCALARRWWVGYFVEQAVAACPELEEDRAWETLNQHWLIMAKYVIQRLTILANPALMSGLLAHLSEHPVANEDELKAFLHHVGMAFSGVDVHAWRADEVRERLGKLNQRRPVRA